MRIHKGDTAGLIIDIQERLHPKIFSHEALEQNTTTLIQGLKTLEVPILVTQQYTKALGETIKPVQDALGEFSYYDKKAFSCCDSGEFTRDLASQGKNNVIIAGEETHVCVLQTGVDLLEMGYQPIIVEDCVSSRSNHDKTVAIQRLWQSGAIITTHESLLFELTRYAGTDEFKTISKLLK